MSGHWYLNFAALSAKAERGLEPVPVKAGGTPAKRCWAGLLGAAGHDVPLILKVSLGPNRTKQRPKGARMRASCNGVHWPLRKIGWLPQLPRLPCPTGWSRLKRKVGDLTYGACFGRIQGRERGREGERERNFHRCMAASVPGIGIGWLHLQPRSWNSVIGKGPAMVLLRRQSRFLDGLSTRVRQPMLSEIPNL